VRCHFVDVLLLPAGHLLLHLLNFALELADLFDQARLVLLLQLSIFLHLLSHLDQLGLQGLSGGLAVAHELLVLGHVLLQVVEDLELLVERDQGVQFVLQLYLFLLQSDLQLVFLALIEHRGGEGTRDRRRLHRGGRCRPFRWTIAGARSLRRTRSLLYCLAHRFAQFQFLI